MVCKFARNCSSVWSCSLWHFAITAARQLCFPITVVFARGCVFEMRLCLCVWSGKTVVSIQYRRASMVYVVVYIEYKSSIGVVRWFTCNTKVVQSWCSSDGRCFRQTLDRQVSVNQSQQGGTALAIHSTGDHKTHCAEMLRKVQT